MSNAKAAKMWQVIAVCYTKVGWLLSYSIGYCGSCAAISLRERLVALAAVRQDKPGVSC